MEMIVYRGGYTEAVAGDSWSDSPSVAWQYAMMPRDDTVTITVGRITCYVDEVDGVDVIDTDTRDVAELRRVLGSSADVVAYADTIPGMRVGHTCYRQMADGAVEVVGSVTLPFDADWDDVECELAEAGLI